MILTAHCIKSYHSPYFHRSFATNKLMAAHLLMICLYTCVSLVASQAQSEHECLCNVLSTLKGSVNKQPQLLDRLGLIEQQMYTLDRRYKANNVCKCGWVREESSCYFFENKQFLTWENAARYCQEKESHLVRVDSLQEHNFIKAQLVKLNPYNDQSFWTAGNDRKTEGIFVWGNSNDRISSTYWHDGEPNNGGDADCLTYYFHHLFFDWDDDVCFKQQGFICEIE